MYLVFFNFFKAVFAMAEFSQEDELVKRTGLGRKTTENPPFCFGLCQALSLRLGSFDTPFSIIPRLHLFNPPHPPASPPRSSINSGQDGLPCLAALPLAPLRWHCGRIEKVNMMVIF